LLNKNIVLVWFYYGSVRKSLWKTNMESKTQDSIVPARHLHPPHAPVHHHQLWLVGRCADSVYLSFFGKDNQISPQKVQGGVFSASYKLVINPWTIDISPIIHNYWKYHQHRIHRVFFSKFSFFLNTNRVSQCRPWKNLRQPLNTQLPGLNGNPHYKPYHEWF